MSRLVTVCRTAALLRVSNSEGSKIQEEDSEETPKTDPRRPPERLPKSGLEEEDSPKKEVETQPRRYVSNCSNISYTGL
ncbi:hypothetical protein QE152_g5724 [Popillia japonica]|uniref:Uncharacterized protein n=1 Tax=Popillia japonica TaxID=7064 RepID=A0AAW1MHY6_POPJA